MHADIMSIEYKRLRNNDAEYKEKHECLPYVSTKKNIPPSDNEHNHLLCSFPNYQNRRVWNIMPLKDANNPCRLQKNHSSLLANRSVLTDQESY